MKTALIDKNNRNKILEYLKKRQENIIKDDPNWNKANIEWKKIYINPLISAILKIEDDNYNFTKAEILMIESCINENK
jgi:hypothetical protein